jgi:hypothetical protein
MGVTYIQPITETNIYSSLLYAVIKLSKVNCYPEEDMMKMQLAINSLQPPTST